MKLKESFKVFAIMAFLCSLLLPASAKKHNTDTTALQAATVSLLDEHFAGIAVVDIDKDHDGTDIRLADGSKIEVDNMGEWKEIKAATTVPSAIIPVPVLKTVKNTFPSASIYEIERKYNGNYEVKLDNGVKMNIGSTGDLVRQR